MNALFLTLLNMSIAAGWSVLAVLLLRLCLRKAPKWISCLLWCIPALRLLIPVFWESNFSLVPSSQVIPTDITHAEIPIIYSGFSEVNSTVNPVLTQQADSLAPLLKIAVTVWLAGLGIMLLYSLISWLYLRFTVRVSLQHSPRVYLCDQVKSPFIFGLIRPRIYLPSGLDQATMEHVLSHEQAHLRRLDHLWKPLGYLLLSIYWFNPLLWVAYILLCRDIERACDEQVLHNTDEAGRLRYAKALVDCSTHRRMILTCPIAFGEVSVKTRIKAVLSYKKPAFWVVLVAVIACTVASFCFLTNPRACHHRYQGQITLAATCTQKGNETFTCIDCGHSYMAMIAVCPHNYGASRVLQASDCASHGQEELTCADCGFVFVQPLPLAADVHDLHGATVKEPLCGVPGVGNTTCSRCSYLQAYEIPALEHVYELTERIEPNCSHSGQEIHTCKLCGDQTKTRLPRNGKHNWQGDSYSQICWYCGSINWGIPSFSAANNAFNSTANNTSSNSDPLGHYTETYSPPITFDPVWDHNYGRNYFP